MSIKKKKIKSQPEDSLINTSAVSLAPNGSPQDREEPKEAGEERTDAEKRDLRDLAEDIIIAHDTRVKIVGEIIDDTHRMMANFKTKREQMAVELQKLLAKGESLRKKDFERMMIDIIDVHAKREEEVREMLESFRREEEEVQEKLRNLLKKGEEVRIKDFKKMMTEIKHGQEKRIRATNESVTDQLQRMQEEVHTMLDNFKTERQSVASAWHQILGFFRTGAEEPGSINSPQARAASNPGSNLPAEVSTKAGPDSKKHQPAYAETASAGK